MLILLSGLASLNISTGIFILLIVCVLAVCFFEFINGFHDTANAVATVIYTNSLSPTRAVVISGIFNFIGVIFGGLGVAMGILKLLPLTELMYSSLEINIIFLLSVLLAAILWNFGTWYIGLPASSSHTLIGSLIGASMVFANVSDEQITKAYEVFTFLLITPVFGFFVAWILLAILRFIYRDKRLYETPATKDAPPLGIRFLTILGCLGISYTHGSNDGQKGVGLLMVVLIAFLPAYFALVPDFSKEDSLKNLEKIEQSIVLNSNNKEFDDLTLHLQEELDETKLLLAQLGNQKKINFGELPKKLILDIRVQHKSVLPKHIKKIVTYRDAKSILSKEQLKTLSEASKKLTTFTDFAPNWTILLISICLGIGTMIGWKRVVVTIGEKIGRSGFDYSQGMISQVVSASTIFASTYFKLPVSTTHIVSSSIMGTMFAKGGKQNIQMKTIKNILMAWILTLPVSIGLSAGLFLLLKFIFL
jgi:inorganic phosphate transporter, PiT family